MKSKPTSLILIASLFTVAGAWRLPRAQEPPHKVEIVAHRFEFSPSEITLKKGEPVILVLTAKDVTHGLKLEAFNQLMKADKGQSSQVEFTPAETGTFVAQCAVFCGTGHGSMKLTVHVTE